MDMNANTFPFEGRMLVGVNYWGSKAGVRMSIRENDGCVFEVTPK